MDKDLNINYSFSLSDMEQKPVAENRPDLIAFAASEHHYLPNNSVLVCNKYNGKQTALSRDVYIAMDHCRDFRTIEGHADYLLARMPELQGKAAEITAVIKSTADAGLMLSAKQICKTLPVASTGVELQDLPVVWITTCDRPELAERLIQSIVENTDPSSIQRCYLVDDSRDPGNIELNQAIVSAFQAKAGFRLIYVGRAEQDKILTQLIDRLPQHEQELRFLLDYELWSAAHSCGRARNFGVLLSIGQRSVLIDDDVICKFYRPAQFQEGVEVSERIREADFFSTRAESLESAEPLSTDPLAEFCRCLGLDFSQALANLGVDAINPEDIQGASVDYLKDIRADSKVIMTACGTLGDPGASVINWLPSLSKDCRTRLLSIDGKLEDAFELRHLWLGRSKAYFANNFNMSPMTGMDNRECLPPYFPIFRGEDLVFGCMVDFLYPSSVALDYPWAVPHLPMPERKGYINGGSLKVQSGSALIAMCIQNWKKDVSATSTSVRLNSLASKLYELCDCSTEDLQQLQLNLLTEQRVALLFKLEELLKETDIDNQCWKDYLQKGLEENYRAIQEQENQLPDFGPAAGTTNKQKIEYLCNLGRRYADTLLAWPQIREQAAEVVAGLFD